MSVAGADDHHAVGTADPGKPSADRYARGDGAEESPGEARELVAIGVGTGKEHDRKRPGEHAADDLARPQRPSEQSCSDEDEEREEEHQAGDVVGLAEMAGARRPE